MLTQYQFQLTPEKHCRPRPEWAYYLYAALLEQASPAFSETVHHNGVTPVSQFLRTENNILWWTVSLFGEYTRQQLGPLLEQNRQYFLQHNGICLHVSQCRKQQIADVDALFERSAALRTPCRLQFHTATAFKSQGRYVNLPTMRLIIQNLVKKWNGCFADTCPIEDTDGQGLDALASGLYCTGFRLRNDTFYLKSSAIPGFAGSMELENRLTGFHRQLLDVLLLFADFSGIGIKTTLGMGGVQCHWR